MPQYDREFDREEWTPAEELLAAEAGDDSGEYEYEGEISSFEEQTVKDVDE